MSKAKLTAKQSEYPFWIKERHNPQLGVYYVAEGQMSKTAARRRERGGCYGSNVMHEFPTRKAYLRRLNALREQGERVHNTEAAKQ